MFVLMFASLSVILAGLFIALIASLRVTKNTVFQTRPPAEQAARRGQQSGRFPETYSGAPALTDEDRDGYLQVWNSVCSRFTSDPKTAVCYADLLMSDIVGDSAEFALERKISQKYNRAHEIADRNRRQGLDPDELALAINLYGAVFAEVLPVEDQGFPVTIERHQVAPDTRRSARLYGQG